MLSESLYLKGNSFKAALYTRAMVSLYRSVLFLALLKISMVFALPSSTSKIPNGENVPHPCEPNYFWKGVGHHNPLGGGAINTFGKDFKDAGKQWTRALCLMDSDGDNRTNGEELGDPDCTWTVGGVPKFNQGVTHPGICEPYDDPICKTKKDWLSCDPEDFKCDAVNEVSTKNITVRFPETAVPNSITSYYCMMFELPKDGDYHIVANKPYIATSDIVHHMLLYGCDETNQEITGVEFNKPYSCGMVAHPQCKTVIGNWLVGSTGQCPHTNSGFRIGTKGYKKAVIKIHWNNPQMKTSYRDSSGMTIYYTPQLRPNDAIVLMIGQTYLEIPPGKEEVSAQGDCSSDCSRQQFRGPLYVTEAKNHMHYLGIRQHIEQYRNGTKIRDITREEVYSYDSPTFYSFEDPVEVLPGDKLKTTCKFNSVGKSLTTFQGESTSGEMCFGFLTVYPARNLNDLSCISWKSIPQCKFLLNQDVNGCSLKTFKNSSHPDMLQLRTDVFKRCVPFGNCLEECKKYVKTLKASHPCLKNDVDQQLRNYYTFTDAEMVKFYGALDSCNIEIERDKCQCDKGCDVSSASGVIRAFITIAFPVMLIYLLTL